MLDNKVLSSLKKFIQLNVANKIKLKKASDSLDSPYELVNPAVFVGWMPPNDFNNEYSYTIPAITVMIDGGEDSGESTTLDIRINIATCDYGTVNNGGLIPNYDGYKDVQNVIDEIRIALSKNANIDNYILVDKPIRWGMHEEQPYPYWYGWMTFQVNVSSLDITDKKINQYL